jgi:hypothetical protein
MSFFVFYFFYYHLCHIINRNIIRIFNRITRNSCLVVAFSYLGLRANNNLCWPSYFTE